MTAHTIARSLSPAQKTALVHGIIPTIPEAWFGNSAHVTNRQLQRRGLMGNYQLTPLGQSVRAIIEEEGK